MKKMFCLPFVAILSFASLSPADSLTSLMIPRLQRVPEGEGFELKCVSRRVLTNGSRVRNELYKVEGDSRSYLSQTQAGAGETNYTTYGNRATVTTIFRLQASEDSAGKYGCVPVLQNATRPTVFTVRQKSREVTVEVCSEPNLQLDHESTEEDLISVSADEICGYKGELTWRVNGREALQRSTPGNEGVQVVEENSLELRSVGCHETAESMCDVTAVFTYIATDEMRVRSVSETLQISGCCVQDLFLSAEVATNGDVATEAPWPVFPPHPLDVVTENHDLEKEVFGLEKQVLELKLEALPMQIKFLRRLNRDHSQGRDMEKVEDI